ncbi:ABC transporter permease [Ramlibacter tataouinensis]|uniref:ABC transporter permease n=1 Tax=Ramlibacter tataouinensis TaxID=94132 RepID=UPI003F816E3D
MIRKLQTASPAGAALDAEPAPGRKPVPLYRRALRSGPVQLGGGALIVLVLVALFAPWLGTIDPTAIDPASSNLLPGTSAEFMSLAGDSFQHLFLMGSDSLGRDVWSRVLYGTRVSLTVGIAVAVLALAGGIVVGLAAGYFRRIDGLLMRLMDGVMAIPGILFAITLVAAWGASVVTLVVAIAIPEIPRVARLLRSVVLTIREEPYVEAAIALDTPPLKVLLRHILPNAIAPLIVQGTYICAAAILVEAILSFLGVGMPVDIPTWGNIMAEGRIQFTQYPHNVLFPGAFLAATVLAVNILGDGLRDTLDPKFSKRGA